MQFAVTLTPAASDYRTSPCRGTVLRVQCIVGTPKTTAVGITVFASFWATLAALLVDHFVDRFAVPKMEPKRNRVKPPHHKRLSMADYSRTIFFRFHFRAPGGTEP